jgi:hypothetical protein
MTTNIQFFLAHLAQFFLAKEMFQPKGVEKIKTRISRRSITPKKKKKRAVYEIIWRLTVKPDRPDITI